jgi:hypothetical protein
MICDYGGQDHLLLENQMNDRAQPLSPLISFLVLGIFACCCILDQRQPLVLTLNLDCSAASTAIAFLEISSRINNMPVAT